MAGQNAPVDALELLLSPDIHQYIDHHSGKFVRVARLGIYETRSISVGFALYFPIGEVMTDPWNDAGLKMIRDTALMRFPLGRIAYAIRRSDGNELIDGRLCGYVNIRFTLESDLLGPVMYL